MASIAQDVAHQTLDSLQQRLQRVQFLLHGTTSSDVQDNPPAVMPQTQSIASRLHGLQTSFDSVLSASKSARDIVALRTTTTITTTLPLSADRPLACCCQNRDMTMLLPT
jgi:hypothetical protein